LGGAHLQDRLTKMNTSFEDYEKYLEFEEAFDAIHAERGARRMRKAKVHHQPKLPVDEVLESVADLGGLEAGLRTTYTPARHEAWWLETSLRPFFEQELIDDVEALVKGGKEANVYRCRAHPATGATWLAAKVYRPRMFRNLRNDHRYRQGRTVLTAEGVAAKATDARLTKALGKKTAFGQQLAHTSWLMHEYVTLDLLHRAGGAVPRPVASAENAILMAYLGDTAGAAPALNEVRLGQEEARPILREVLRNVALLLRNGRVHGDLSAYNVLYWEGQIALIDFPQVVNSRVGHDTHPRFSAVNPEAYDILARDLQRVCQYFRGYGIDADGRAIAAALWERYAAVDAEDRLADLSILEGDS
jgi:RIO kinase 1